MARVNWEIRDATLPLNCLRVFVIGDNSRATHAIHLIRPLQRLRFLRLCALRYITGPYLDTGLPVETDRDNDILSREWRRFQPDVVIISRYQGRCLSTLIEVARRNSTPIIAHFDDDLLNTAHPLHEYSPQLTNDKQRLSGVKFLVSNADFVYVPTERLARSFIRHGINRPIIVAGIQSGVSTREIHKRKRINTHQSKNTKFCIGFMGSRGHREDLRSIVNDIVTLLSECPKLVFHCFGTIEAPMELQTFGDRVVHHRSEKHYAKFLRKLATLNWDIGLAPLLETPFNEAKSYTKWVEYSAAGITTLASQGTVYDEVCSEGRGFLASEGQWLSMMRHLLNDAPARYAAVDKAQEHLRRKCSLNRLERQLLNVIQHTGVCMPKSREKLINLLSRPSELEYNISVVRRHS